MNNHNDITELIKDFQSLADTAVKIFQKKYKIQDPLEGWRLGIYKQTGELKDQGIKFYAFHGIGIAAHFPDKMVDFDFAYIPEVRWDGFESWKLWTFAERQPEKYPKYKNKEVLDLDFKALKNEHLIIRPDSEHYTSLYFWKESLTAEQIARSSELKIEGKKPWWKF